MLVVAMFILFLCCLWEVFTATLYGVLFVYLGFCRVLYLAYFMLSCLWVRCLIFVVMVGGRC